MDTTDWLKSGEYLPQWLRDFHDQKNFFKALDEVADRSRENGNTYIDGIGFVAAQVFTVDIFLWMAARHGYTLQRSRKRVEFNDLDAFVSAAKRRREEEYRKVWATRLPAESGPGVRATSEQGNQAPDAPKPPPNTTRLQAGDEPSEEAMGPRA